MNEQTFPQIVTHVIQPSPKSGQASFEAEDRGNQSPNFDSVRRSGRSKRKTQFNEYVSDEDDNDDELGKKSSKKRKPIMNPSFVSSPTALQTRKIKRQRSDPDYVKKSKKKKGKSKSKKGKGRSKKYSSGRASSDEGELIVDDPNSYYDTDEYDSDGKLIKRDEIKKKILEEEKLQRKLKRKPNIPHLIKKYTPIPMDENGQPIFPISLRGLTIHSLGKVVWDRPKFHAKRYIWPVGLKSERIYNSMTQLDKKCVYTSEITDNGDEPAFVVTCWEDKDNPIVITRPTASGAWAEVGKRFFELKKEVTGRDTMTQLSGPEMFGFAHPTIAKLIQDMPGAELCKSYIRQQFVPASAKIKGIDDKPKRSYNRGKRRKYGSGSEEDSDEESELSMSDSSDENEDFNESDFDENNEAGSSSDDSDESESVSTPKQFTPTFQITPQPFGTPKAKSSPQQPFQQVSPQPSKQALANNNNTPNAPSRISPNQSPMVETSPARSTKLTIRIPPPSPQPVPVQVSPPVMTPPAVTVPRPKPAPSQFVPQPQVPAPVAPAAPMPGGSFMDEEEIVEESGTM